MVICLEQGADLHMAQLMPLPLTVSCSSKIQTGFTFLVAADLGTPGKRAVERVCLNIHLQTDRSKRSINEQLYSSRMSVISSDKPPDALSRRPVCVSFFFVFSLIFMFLWHD